MDTKIENTASFWGQKYYLDFAWYIICGSEPFLRPCFIDLVNGPLKTIMTRYQLNTTVYVTTVSLYTGYHITAPYYFLYTSETIATL